MEDLIKWAKWGFENYTAILNGLDLIVAGLISIFALIPGPEPERSLRKIVELIELVSRKKKNDD